MAHEAIAVWETLEDTMQADLLERTSWASALPRSAPVDMTPSPADCSSPREHVIEIPLMRIARNREIGEDFSPPRVAGDSNGERRFPSATTSTCVRSIAIKHRYMSTAVPAIISKSIVFDRPTAFPILHRREVEVDFGWAHGELTAFQIVGESDRHLGNMGQQVRS
jgi:hypothetical protein